MTFRLLVASLILSLATNVHADEAPAAAQIKHAVPLIPLEKDLVGGHLQIGASASYALPFGRLSEEFKHTNRSGSGGVFGLDLDYGLDRFVTLGAYGEYQLWGASDPCPECSAWGWAAGLQLGYHAVQGLRIDPWVSYGVGFRQLLSQVDESDLSYDAIEWMRLSLGTNWFATPNFCLSPLVLFSAATTVNVPSGEHAGATDMRFQFGLRVALDLPGQ
jgi:hypothetical protein